VIAPEFGVPKVMTMVTTMVMTNVVAAMINKIAKGPNARSGLRHAISDNPLRLYRPSRLAALLDTDETTIWRWARDGVLPPPVQVAGIKGWTHEMIRKLLEVES
jgi:predicted DNA-binding transcriptional regulator AlpA